MTNLRRFLTTACLVALAALLGIGGVVLKNLSGGDDRSDRLEWTQEVKAVQLDRRETEIPPVVRNTPQFLSADDHVAHTPGAAYLRSPALFLDRIVRQQQMRK